ncbi:MAG: histidine phosphatase family protein [Oscillospiraceae bacterium]|nr:histidine phosphatase family protein [Oscillospiraceae bacterium]
MKLLLIRHGDPDYETDSLTPTGQREAELLAERIAPLPVRDYYVSTMGRALATAAPTLAKAGREAIPCDWLREFQIPVPRPDREGLYHIPWDWLPQDWLADPILLDPFRWHEHPVFAGYGVREYYDRVCAAFDGVLAEHGYVREGPLYRAERPNGDTLVFFCHFGLSCVLLSHLMHCSPMVLWHGLAMAPSSVSVVNSEERRPGLASFRAAALGDISHLYVKGQEPSFSARFCEIYGNGERVD